MRQFSALLAAAVFALTLAPSLAAEQPDLIFKRSTVFKWLTPNDKLATYGLDDPEVEGCLPFHRAGTRRLTTPTMFSNQSSN